MIEVQTARQERDEIPYDKKVPLNIGKLRNAPARQQRALQAENDTKSVL